MAEPSNMVHVFDLDDTLYLERDFALSGFAAVCRYLRERDGIDDLASRFEALLAAGRRNTIFNEVLRDLGHPCDDVLIARLVEIYRDHIPQISLPADADACLARIGGRTAIITDGPAQTQRNKIAALGIDRRIGKVITTGSWPSGFGKPNPRAFLEVMAWSGMPAHRHVYIADNPAKDFLAPRALGWQTVQIDRIERIHDSEPPSPAHAAHARISSLDDLPACLERISSPASACAGFAPQ